MSMWYSAGQISYNHGCSYKTSLGTFNKRQSLATQNSKQYSELRVIDETTTIRLLTFIGGRALRVRIERHAKFRDGKIFPVWVTIRIHSGDISVVPRSMTKEWGTRNMIPRFLQYYSYHMEVHKSWEATKKKISISFPKYEGGQFPNDFIKFFNSPSYEPAN